MIALNHFTPEQLKDIEAELRLGWNRKAVMAEMGRRQIAEINSEEVVWRDDWRVEMRMDAVVALYWKLREGNDVWEDSFHKGYFKKHFPEVFTKQRSGKIQHGYKPGANGNGNSPRMTQMNADTEPKGTLIGV